MTPRDPNKDRSSESVTNEGLPPVSEKRPVFQAVISCDVPCRCFLLPMSPNQCPVPLSPYCPAVGLLLLLTVLFPTSLFSCFPLFLSRIFNVAPINASGSAPPVQLVRLADRGRSFSGNPLDFLCGCLARREEGFVALDET